MSAPPDGKCRGCGVAMPAGLHPFPWCDLMHQRDPCPKCGAPLKENWSGVECTRCSYWFCF